MSYLNKKKFSFESTALAKDTFAVVEFKGSEALSRPYEFEITLVTERSDIDLNSVLQQPASFTFHRETGGDVRWNGIIAEFEQLNNFNLYTFYRAHLVPKLWWLQLTHHNQIFLDKTVKQIIEAVLKDGGLTSRDFEFKLQRKYSKIDYVCQYEESHYDFISRWMEREGLYYYFEQTESAEKIIITDTNVSHAGMPLGDTLYYSPPSGLDALHRTEVIQSFSCRQKLIPSKVFMKDYNYETPSLSVTGSAPVDPKGRGDVYFYGENFRNPAEGNRLAKIRSEEILCRKEQYIGESTVPFIMPGYSYKLEDHYRSDFNKEYLIVGVDFSGSQSGYLMAGIQQGLSEREKKVYYSNNFTAIPYSVQFRTERRTKKSKIFGTIPAKVDAAGSGQYAELDDQGRYKVILPFDESGRKDGKASIFLRMVQPYAGGDHGMHFPLHKGTEVMIAFTDGDPDRPIIAGAVPNPETQSVVTDRNFTKNTIRSGSGNMFVMNDLLGQEAVQVSSPYKDSYLHLGAPSSPKREGELVTRGSIRVEAGKDYDLEVATEESGKLTETVRNGNYKRTVEDTGKLTEDIGNTNYLKTIDDAGQFTEDMQSRTIDVKGTTTETYGQQEITVKGNSKWRFELPSTDVWGSIRSETCYGLKNENFFGGKLSVFGGTNNDINLVNKNELCIAAVIQIFFGIAFDLGLSLTIQCKYAPDIGKNFAVKISEDEILLEREKIALMNTEVIRLKKSMLEITM